MLKRILLLLLVLSGTGTSWALGHGDCAASAIAHYVDQRCQVLAFEDDGRPLPSEYGYQAVDWSKVKPPSNALYVDPVKGKAGAKGTMDAPLAKISEALARAKPGQTVLLRAGVYAESVSFPRSGKPGQPIRLMGYLGEQAVIAGDGRSNHVVQLVDKRYLELNNLHIRFASIRQGGDEVPRRAVLSNVELRRSSHTVLANLHIINPNANPKAVYEAAKRFDIREMGILLQEGSEHNLVVNNRIEGMLSQAMMLGRGGHYNAFVGNTTRYTLGNGFMLDAQFGEFQNTLIERNRLFHSVMSDGIQSNHDFATNNPQDTSAIGLVIRHNLIAHNGENGIDIKGSSQLLIEHNYIYANAGVNNGGYDDEPRPNCLHGCTASAIMIGSNTRSRNVIVRYNTVFDNPGGIAFWHRWMVYNNTLVNNRRFAEKSNLPVVELGSPRFRKPVTPALEGWGQGAVILNNVIGNHRDAEVVLIQNNQLIDGNVYFNQLQNDQTPLFAIDYHGNGKAWHTRRFAAWQAYLAGLQVAGQGQHSQLIDPEQLLLWQADAVFETDFSDLAVAELPAARDLTQTASSGEGQRLPVLDSRYFFTGFGVTPGDEIVLAQPKQGGGFKRARLLSISGNELRLDRPLSWEAGEGVRLYRAARANRVGAH